MYLFCLLAGSAGLVALDRRFRLFFWRSPRAAAAVLGIGVAFFLAWDAAGIAAGIFMHSSSPFAAGILLAPELPLEEPVFLAFFSYAAMLLFTGAERILGRPRARPRATARAGAPGRPLRNPGTTPRGRS